MTRESEQTRKAYAVLSAARKELIETKGAIVEISNRAGAGVCACDNGHACAYHADLLNRIDEVGRRVDGVLAELRADIAYPDRKH
jgi:hypothetical protein